MSFTTPGDVLGLIGGVPQAVPKTVWMEKIKASKSLSMRIDSVMSQMMSQVGAGGSLDLSAMFQNPMAAASSLLGGGVTGAITQVTNALGANGLTSSLGSLSTALTTLQGHIGELTGQVTDGTFSVQSLISHANMAGEIGQFLPANLSLATVTAPIFAGNTLSGIANAIPGIVAGAISNPATVAAAAAIIDGHTATLTSLYQNSVDALTKLPQVMPGVASALSAAATYVGTLSKYAPDPQMQTLMRAIIQPNVIAELDALDATLFPPRPDMPEPGVEPEPTPPTPPAPAPASLVVLAEA